MGGRQKFRIGNSQGKQNEENGRRKGRRTDLQFLFWLSKKGGEVRWYVRNRRIVKREEELRREI